MEAKPKLKTIHSCGGFYTNKDGYSFLYEQILSEGKPAYAVYSMDTDKVYVQPYLQPNRNLMYKPYNRLPWKPPTEAAPYESEKQLWQDVYDCIHKHWDHSNPTSRQIMTAWTFASWLIELWLATPYIFFHGALESGKSRGLEILASLSKRGWLALSMTSANVCRPTQTWKPTLFMDEAETYAKMPEITGLLNASYRRGNLVPRQRETPHGYVTDFFDLFTFKAIAGTKQLADTLESRCIRFRMSRTTRNLRLFIDKTETTQLRNQLLTYRFKKLGEMLGKVTLPESAVSLETLTEELIPTEAYERFAEKLGSSRLAELFFPLIYVAPSDKIRNSIFTFALELDKQRWEELTASPEPIVLAAIISCYKDNKVQSGSRIKIGDVADVINQNLPEKEKWSNRYVSAKARALGFIKTYIHGRVAIRYDTRLVERLKSDPRYKHCFDDTLPPQSVT